MGLLVDAYEMPERPPDATLQTTVASLLTEFAELSARRQRLPKLAPEWHPSNYPLKQFVLDAWPIIEPGRPFVDGMHIDAICLHLTAVTEGKIRYLLINVPPRTSKSRIVSVFWPAWVWISKPGFRWLCTSYSGSRTLNDAGDAKTLIESAWYQERWGNRVMLTKDTAGKGHFKTTVMGHRISVPLEGSGTGESGDVILGDDLHSTDEDDSETRAELVAKKDAWKGKMSNRVTDPKKSAFVVVGQRVAADDISHDLIETGLYEHLCIPMEYDPDLRKPPTSIGWADPRTVPGESLCPERFPPAYLAELKRTMPPRKYAAQYQQAPTSREGQLFQRSWWRWLQEWPDIRQCDVVAISCDARFKDENEAGSYVCMMVMGRIGQDIIIYDFICELLGFLGTRDTLKMLKQKWPMVGPIWLENKANGQAIYQSLRSEVPGIIMVDPQGSKYARAEAVTPIVRGLPDEPGTGHVWLPPAYLAPWGEKIVAAGERFPAKPDDEIDTLSQGLSLIYPYKAAVDEERLKQRQMQQARQRLAQLVQQHNGHFRKGTGV